MRESDAHDYRVVAEIDSLGIETNGAPGTGGGAAIHIRWLAKNARKQTRNIGMIGIEMGDRGGLEGEHPIGAVHHRANLFGRERCRAREAAVQMRILHLDLEEGKVREIGIEFGLRMTGKKPLARRGAVLRVLDAPRAAQDRETRMCQGIAAARRIEQQREARIGDKMTAMRGKLGE